VLEIEQAAIAIVFHFEQPIRTIERLGRSLSGWATMIGSAGGEMRGLDMLSWRVSAPERLGIGVQKSDRPDQRAATMRGRERFLD
jgi:hypothetical protein